MLTTRAVDAKCFLLQIRTDLRAAAQKNKESGHPEVGTFDIGKHHFYKEPRRLNTGDLIDEF
jgi:hypothetical protein